MADHDGSPSAGAGRVLDMGSSSCLNRLYTKQTPEQSSRGTIIEGFLQKVSGLRHAWKTRYFRLRVRGDSVYMEKLKSSEDPVVRDRYPILLDTKVRPTESGRYGFSVKNKKLSLKFTASTSLERVQWINALQRCIADLQPHRDRKMGSGVDLSDTAPPESLFEEEESELIASGRPELDGLAQELRSKQGIKKKTHYFKYQNVKQSFRGVTIVEWLVDKKFSATEKEACEVGQELLKWGKITRVDGKLQFPGGKELYVFNKAHSMTAVSLMSNVEELTKRVQQLQFDLYQVDNHSEEMLDTLQEQIVALRRETKTASRRVQALSGAAAAIAGAIAVMSIWGNFESVPLGVRLLSVFLLLAVLGAGYVVMTSKVEQGVIAKEWRVGLENQLHDREAKRAAHRRTRSSRSLDPKFVAQFDDRSRNSLSASTSPATARTKSAANGSTRTAKPPTAAESAGGARAGPATDGKAQSDAKATDISSPGHWTMGKEPNSVVYKKLSSSVTRDCWSEPDGRKFKVRGPGYLTDRIKNPSIESRFELALCEMCAVDEKLEHLAAMPHSSLQRLRADSVFPPGSHPFKINYIVVQFQIPGISFSLYLRAKKGLKDKLPRNYVDLFHRFVDGSNAFRNERLKIIPTVVTGPWIARKFVGAKPALIGQKLTCTYHRGKDYLEIDIDVTSSFVANKILNVCTGYAKSLVVDLGFLIEARDVLELPEIMLSAVRWNFVNLDDVVKLSDVTRGRSRRPSVRKP